MVLSDGYRRYLVTYQVVGRYLPTIPGPLIGKDTSDRYLRTWIRYSTGYWVVGTYLGIGLYGTVSVCGYAAWQVGRAW